MSNDYISRKAAKLHLYKEFITDQDICCRAFKALKSIPPADVIPRATIAAGIEEAIALLNAINGEGRLDYQAYSELHDAITGILPEKEADSDV